MGLGASSTKWGCSPKNKRPKLGNRYLFGIKQNSYLGSTDSGGNPSGVPIRRQRQWGLIRQGRGTTVSKKEGIAIAADTLTQ